MLVDGSRISVDLGFVRISGLVQAFVHLNVFVVLILFLFGWW